MAKHNQDNISLDSQQANNGAQTADVLSPIPPSMDASSAPVNSGAPESLIPSPVSTSASLPTTGKRRTPTDWKDRYVDNGREYHLKDRAKAVNFDWVTKHIGISRSTLERARAAGTLLTYAKQPSWTRTDWLHHFMLGQVHASDKGTKSWNAQNRIAV